jgi:hypothetical protein
MKEDLEVEKVFNKEIPLNTDLEWVLNIYNWVFCAHVVKIHFIKKLNSENG